MECVINQSHLKQLRSFFSRGQNGSKGVVEQIDATSVQNAQIKKKKNHKRMPQITFEIDTSIMSIFYQTIYNFCPFLTSPVLV